LSLPKPTFNAPIVRIVLHYILLCVFASSSDCLLFNCLISGTLTGCKHLSKQVAGCKTCPCYKH